MGDLRALKTLLQRLIYRNRSALLVDEAAQGTEPDVLIPLSVVTPPEEFSTELPIFVMAGDQKQLGPRTASKSPQLETSLLDRLFSRTLYFDHPLSRQGLAKVGQGTAPEWITRLSASMLVSRTVYMFGINLNKVVLIHVLAIYQPSIYQSHSKLSFTSCNTRCAQFFILSRYTCTRSKRSG